MDARLIDLQHITDAKGDLVVAEFSGIPFSPERAFWFYNLRKNDFRGGHANHKCEQVFVAMQGSLHIFVRNAISSTGPNARFYLDRPTQGLYVGPSVWRIVKLISGDPICLVMASMPYDETDYIRTWDEYEEVWGR